MKIKRPFLLFLRKSLSDKTYIRVRYLIIFKKWLRLRHPKTFNEKINWLKLNYKNAELPKFADKYNVREYIKKQIGAKYLNKIYGVYNTPEEINWDALPDQFVLKATHGSGWIIICNDKNKLNLDWAKSEMNSWLQSNYYELWGEPVYKYLKPRIICEKYLEGNSSEGLVDYKFYCFDGIPKFLHVDVNRFNDQHYINFYDLEWNKLPIKKGLPNSPQLNNRPKNLSEMIEIVKKLSQNLPFVRVDLYEDKGQVLFGELTFYPQNGLSSFYPKKYEHEFGKLIDLKGYKSSNIRFYKNPSFTFIYRLRYYLSRFTLFEKIVVSIKKRRGDFQDQDFIDYLNNADDILLSNKDQLRIPKVGLVKDIDNYGKYVQKRSHWPKYERFLVNNNIQYEFLDIHGFDWVEKAKEFNLIIFRPDISPSKLHEAKSKIYYLEQYLKIKCFPSSHEIWAYEDKIRANYLYQHFNIPHVNTFITNNKTEALDYINKAVFPKVSKITCGSVSRGVRLIKNKKQAKRLVRKIFSNGITTYWAEYKQRNYVYFQEFIEHALFDLRIIVISDKVTGYYRMSNGLDFRASGSGIWQYNVSELPVEAMKIAVTLKEALKTTILAVDMIKSEHSNQFLVIESSIFYDVDLYEELIVNNITGYYQWENNNDKMNFKFKPGKYWIQELIAKELVRQFQSHNS